MMMKSLGSLLLLLSLGAFCTVTTGCDDDGGVDEGERQVEIGDGDGKIVEDE